MEDTLFYRYVVQGGVMMIALIPCLFLMIAFAVQGILNLRRKKLSPRGFVEQLTEARRKGGKDEARALLEKSDHSLAEILRNVLYHLEFKPDADPAEVLHDQIQGESDVLLQQNSQLSVIYRVTPLLGLLGTVFGMIQTFRDFTESANPDIQQLSIGINMALITTAWGLSIAIPAYVVLYLFQRRIAVYEQIDLPRDGSAALHALLDEGTLPSRTGKEE